MNIQKKPSNMKVEILIVEDSPTQAQQLAHLLENQGFKVLIARSGREALDLLGRHKLELVISDIVMPEMDGYELCRKIKADKNLKEIPVILATFLSEPKDVIKGLECGADNFIIKPYDEGFLLSRINYVLLNRKIRQKEGVQMALQVSFAGERYTITSDRLQILNLLLSTYEAAVQKNLELAEAHEKLRKLNEELEELVNEKTAALSDRVKELKCLYGISSLTQKTNGPLEEVIQNAVDLLPSAFQYPEITCARILIWGKEFFTGNFRETAWKLICPILVDGEPEGRVEVNYLEESPECDEGPFLKEERNLIDDVARQVGGFIERRQANERLKHLNFVLRAIRRVNQLITTEREPDRLIKAACQSLVSTRGYYNAWIVLLDDSGRFESYDEAGMGKDFLPLKQKLECNELPLCGRKALEQLRVVTIKNPAAICTECPLAHLYANKCAAACRLEHGGTVYGLLKVSGPTSMMIDKEEIGLIKEVAADIALGLSNIRIEEGRKQAEQKLGESEQRYRALFESSADGILIADIKTKAFLYANPAICKMLGYKEEELRGMGISDIHPKHELERIIAEFEAQGRGEKTLATDIPCLRKDGTIVHTDINTTMTLIDRKKCNIGFFRDIAERLQAERKLKEYSESLESMVKERTEKLNQALRETEDSREKINGILKSIADGLIVTDNQKRIVLMNHAAEGLLGIRFSDTIGQRIDFVIKEESLKEKIRYTFDKKTTGYEFDFQLAGDDPKKPKIMRARTSVVSNRRGRKTHIITIFSDVTHEREVDRMKTEFLSTAAHEMRTPLTSIQGFSELIINKNDIRREERIKYLSYINKQAVALAKIINDLLDVAKIESKEGLALVKVKCDFGEMVKEIIPYFLEYSKKHKFKLILPRQSVSLYVDKAKVEQVLNNLLDNAVKYSPKGGEIRIIGKADKEFSQISIEDQGIGMTAGQIEKIFDKFYRVDRSDAAPLGTGLGMTIVKYIVEAHGGKVWLESKPGKGTAVRFTLPLKE
jgi:PAS domain S-box-containing protein